MTDAVQADRKAIAELIQSQFRALTWTETESGAAHEFFSGMHDEARMFAARRHLDAQHCLDICHAFLKRPRDNGNVVERYRKRHGCFDCANI